MAFAGLPMPKYDVMQTFSKDSKMYSANYHTLVCELYVSLYQKMFPYTYI